MIECISSKGSGIVNEDAFGHAGSRFWVLDGATPVSSRRFFDEISDAEFLVRRFSREMEDVCREGLPNRETIAEAMNRVRSGLVMPEGYAPELMPGFAMALTDIGGDTVEIDCLSDCTVIISKGGGTEVFTDGRIIPVSEKTRRVKEYVNSRRDEISPEQGKEMIRRQIIENRNLMNKEGGFWVGSLDGAGFFNTKQWSLPLAGISEILICSDGFYRLFQYGIISHEEFFSGKVTLENALPLLRDFESRMADNEEYKRCDDATAIKITL